MTSLFQLCWVEIKVSEKEKINSEHIQSQYIITMMMTKMFKSAIIDCHSAIVVILFATLIMPANADDNMGK